MAILLDSRVDVIVETIILCSRSKTIIFVLNRTLAYCFFVLRRLLQNLQKNEGSHQPGAPLRRVLNEARESCQVRPIISDRIDSLLVALFGKCEINFLPLFWLLSDP